MPTKREHAGGPMPVSHAPHLLNPIRSLLLAPATLVRRLNLNPGATVLEVGPGPGYFSAALARAVPAGKLILADVQPEMLTMAKERLDARGISNADYRCADAAALPLSDDSVDAAVLAAVLGECPDRDACLREVRRVLRPGGVLSICEYRCFDPDYTPRPAMTAAVEAAGFRLRARYGGLLTYMLIFEKPR